MNNTTSTTKNKNDNAVAHRPLILAPAGNKASFLAAIGAGADAVYCGLKNFSARMEADNFGIEELSGLTELAHNKDVKVFVALNSILKQSDIEKALHLIDKLARHVRPDALIAADPAISSIAKAAGFKGDLHLSTLGNMSFPKGINYAVEKLGFNRIVVPRELSIDEIRLMAEACPEKADLEVFVHGALCYGVSGRCYWSSYLGGKSGLRGRCVQPCRRIYNNGREKGRYFSCQDLSLDILARTLLNIPKVKAWKIEGRKKGPHYVYYTVKAYQILRDQGTDPAMRKAAAGLLSQALGRPGTHYNFLPQRSFNPVELGRQTGSGLFTGTMKGHFKAPFIVPSIALLPGDLLRIGYEDTQGHAIYKVQASIPKRGKLHLKFREGQRPAKESPVFLIDRREKELKEIISSLERELEKIPTEQVAASQIKFDGTVRKNQKKRRISQPVIDMNVYRNVPARLKTDDAIWLNKETYDKLPSKLAGSCWFFLPPVIWPDDQKYWEELIEKTLKKGGQKFVLNAPYQIRFFNRPDKLNIWAGPFCNIANSTAADVLADSGFKGIFASPELTEEDFIAFAEKCSMPTGIVISGSMPLVTARTLSEEIRLSTPFTSPKGEVSYAVKHGSDFWIYPDWKLDLTEKKDRLKKAGYTVFANMEEKVPQSVTLKNRPGKWNWDLTLL